MKLFTKALLPVAAIAALAFLVMAASGPQTLVNNAAPFNILSDRQLKMANVSLLSRLMGLPLTASGAQNVLSNAAPFQTFSDRNLMVAETYLLYQLTGAATNIPVSDAAFTNIWLYGEIISGTDGLPLLDKGRALYDENGIDSVDWFRGSAVGGDPLAGYALNDDQGAPSLYWQAKLLVGQWYNNLEFRLTNSATRGILLSYLGSGFTNILVMFTNTGAAGDFVQINQSNLTSGGIVGAYSLLSSNYATFGAGAVGAGTTGETNTAAAQFNYANLQFSTNCGWGVLASNGVANSTVNLAGYEEFVVSMGNTIVVLGSATTNLGHHIAITCGSAGTNAITTVLSQKIAGATKWTNTAVFSCTQLISDGSNWQICGSRGN